MGFIKSGDAEVQAVVSGTKGVLVKCKECQQLIPRGKPCPNCTLDDQEEED